MHRTTVLSALALALSSRVATQGINQDDIAPNCVAVCTNIANVADECERQYNDVPNEDQQELDCLCSAQSMDTLIPSCEACQRQYYGQDDDYDEIQTLLQQCGFSSITMTGTMTAMASAPSTVITTTYTQTDNDDDDNNDVETDTITSYLLTDAGPTTNAGSTTTAGGAAGGASQSASDAGSSATDAAGSAANSATDAAGSATDAAGSAAEQSDNFAPAITAAPVLAVAGLAAAVFGL